ncbi:MAG: hypothetical protein KatS3mg042_1602 [Rhodothermaceae bacterium]|nr:MAG: hypothetical protein KatS3mg042_1602 [Rhodothermaceae bacterium]
MRRIYSLLTCLCMAGLLLVPSAMAQQFQRVQGKTMQRPLSEVIKQPRQAATPRAPYAIPNKWKPKGQRRVQDTNAIDPFLQDFYGSLEAADIMVNVEGVTDDDNSALLGFAVVPPDTQGDVGPNHYVQHVNLAAEIFDKSGTSLTGPFPGNLFWDGFGGDCENANDGDPITLYDHINDRWIVSQFEATSPFSMCIAVSTGPDPLGTYHQYRFNYGVDFPDYPKLGLWATDDGTEILMMTDRSFENLFLFEGVFVSAFEYENMLNGDPAGFIRMPIPGNGEDGYLPADLDGPPAPAGTNPLIFGHEANTIFLYEAAPDFVSGTMPVTLVDSFPSTFDEGLGNVVPPAPGESLDVLTFAAMHRLQYRNFGTHQVLLTNATVDAGGDLAGVKWWELRNTGSGWMVHQEGTYAPDSQERWMGSIAMNGNGDIALGFSVTSPQRFPSIAVTGQTADVSGSGVMNVAEMELWAGAGVQTGSSNRWGDYSAMSVDPTDDMTFWYTQEYYANTGSFDFKTRIVSFTLEGGGGGGGTPVVSITMPADGATFNSGDLITFEGTATDAEDGDLTAAMTWTSSIDGTIGSGGMFDAVLSDGVHTITASATDADGNTGMDQITVTVGQVAGDCSTINEVTMVDGFGFQWCWDATKVDGAMGPDDLVCATDGRLDAEMTGVIENAYANGGTSTAAVCRAELVLEIEAVNNQGDGCTFETDSFIYDGARDGHLSYSGTWVSFCEGIGEVGSGTWAGTFDVSNFNGAPLASGEGPNRVPASMRLAKSGAGQLEGLTNEVAGVPDHFALEQNYPNPFNPTTQIAYALPEGSEVTLKVYNTLGQEVATLVQGYRPAGRHQVTFDASQLSAGVYLYVIRAGDFTATKRLTLLK